MADKIFINKFFSKFKEQFDEKKLSTKFILNNDLNLLILESNKEKSENSESQINIPGIIGYVDFDKCTNLFNFNKKD